MANEDYLNLRLEQFLDSITDKKNIYQVSCLDEDVTIEGTLSEFKSLFSNVSKSNIEKGQKLNQLLQNKQEYAVDFELNDIEIYNYLEKITSSFDPEKTRIVLFDIEVYYNMDFRERIIKESYELFIENDWEIPKIKNPYPIKIKDIEIIEITDIDKMLHKTHPFQEFSIKRAMYLLEKKLKENVNKTESNNSNVLKASEQIENNSLNDFPEIFKDTGYQVFIQLNEKYQKNNKSLRTKFSNLFHFLEYSELLRCTQKEYIEFIKQNFNVTLSKILPKTAKYEDVIQPLLMKYHKGQQ